MYRYKVWAHAPMLRLLCPLITGVLIERYCSVSVSIIAGCGSCAAFLWILFEIIPFSLKFKLNWTNGLAINLLLVSLGAYLSFSKNITHQHTWIGNNIEKTKAVAVTIIENPVEKNKSYKALAKINEAYIYNRWTGTTGNILLYFSKEEAKPAIQYGSQMLITRPLQDISNANNPGGFDYKKFMLQQDIGQQVFLKQTDYAILQQKSTTIVTEWINTTRTKILSILRNYLSSPNEISIAEALLIGYRDDLDRDLVQAYSNTGVVHIIAISGLHLAMIYGLIGFLFKPVIHKKWMPATKAIVTIFVLWSFTMIAGNAPSILRSAVMFTFIVVGDVLGRKNNIYNNLAASAFCILLFNPFSLWDVGFQLSYAAVLSIVIFSKPVTGWFTFQNKIIKGLWNLTAITISAQILTLPFILFYFHQFPVLFLFTNLFAVPFSGVILYGELILILVSPLQSIASFTGLVVSKCIALLNHFIIHINTIPFSQITSIQINILQVILLFIIISGFAVWLLQKNKRGFLLALSAVLLFAVVNSFDLIKKNQQQKIIVYNVPKYTAIDCVEGRNYFFTGDSVLEENNFLQNFYLQPSRILNRIKPTSQTQPALFDENIFSCHNKNIVLINKALPAISVNKKIKANAIIISHNPGLYLSQIARIFDCDQYVFDASNPLWKIRKWKKGCDSLHLRHYSTPEQGAFEVDF